MTLTSDWTDRPVSPRRGEELDRNRLADFLARTSPDLAGELEIEQFPSGYSNLTYLVRVAGEPGAEIVVRRPPFGSRVETAHDMGREFRILSALAVVWPKAPRPLFYCDDPEVLGAPFYGMERRAGLILRGGESAQPPSPEQMHGIAESLVATLVELHAVDAAAVGLGDLGHPRGYVERQVRGWGRRWVAARTDEMSDMDAVAAWLSDHRPADAAPALVHNDFKYDNLVLASDDPTRVIAVLDWEMATLGDPLMDLGTTLGYWTDSDDPEPLRRLALSPTCWPGNLSRRQVARLYAELSGRDLGALTFYYVFGLFKIATIIQQIYYRYQQGLTRDPRFAALGEGVRALALTAARAIEVDRIDRLFDPRQV